MTLQELIAYRFQIIKGMNEIVKVMNDEDSYMRWIAIVPDEATDEDFQEIAEDYDLFMYAVTTFNKLNRRYGDDLNLK